MRIIGNTVGTPLPKPNLLQDDPSKGDYVKGKSVIPIKTSQLENDSGYLTEHQDISGKLDASALPAAINDALAQAKSSGEFDGPQGEQGPKGDKDDTGATGSQGPAGANGKDGTSATHSWNGTTLTITSASGSSSANLKGDKGDTGATGATGATGPKGDSGDSKIAYATCDTAAATAAKVVTVSGNDNWTLGVGSVVMVYFSASNSASNVTLNVNGTGAYPIWYNNSEYTSTGTAYTGYAKRVIEYMFNGTHWVWMGSSYDANTTYKNVSLGHGYATCSTAAATTAKVGTLASYALTLGGTVAVKFTYDVPANATLNINSKGAKNMFYRGAKITAGVIKAGDIATFIYDGTQYQLLSIDRWQNDVAALQTSLNQTAASITQLASDKADKTGLTLGVHTDGLVYLFVNGSPQGNGLEITAETVEGDVFGYVEEDNTIVLNGALADGTYSVKYELEDGTTVNIGNLVLDTNVYHTVTNTLTNCTNSNSATKVAQGSAYSATITAKSGYELKSVSVTMGGSPVSVSGGNITISNVTGNIVITAVAEEIKASYTNLVDPTSSDFWNDSRIGSDGAQRTGATGNVVTNMIKVYEGDVIRISGLNLTLTTNDNNGSSRMGVYNSAKAVQSVNRLSSQGIYFNDITETATGGQATVIYDDSRKGAYLRFAGKPNNGVNNIIITINEPID